MKLLTLSALLLLTTKISGSPKEKDCDDTIFDVFENDYDSSLKCPKDKNFWKDAVHKILDEVNNTMAKIKNVDKNPLTELKRSLLEDFLMRINPSNLEFPYIKCSACILGIKTLKVFKSPFIRQHLIPLFANFCKLFKVSSPDVCDGMINSYSTPVLEILDKSKKGARDICSFFLNFECWTHRSDVYRDFSWKVTLPKPQKSIKATSDFSKGKRTLKVLHLADTHWDTRYVEGTWADCKLPLCCRKENVLPNSKATRAGKYGGWKCDTPEVTFDSLLSHVVKQHPDINYVIWTGDIPAHDIWKQSKKENEGTLKKTVAKIRKAFPSTPVYPALGNHEIAPANLYATKQNGTNPMNWLYKTLSQQWQKWLPSTDLKTIQKGAFYTTLIEKGLRLVSMNTNYCYKFNWWLAIEQSDPVNELHWLAKVLQEAEKNNEKVQIIGHVPPGSSDCLPPWQSTYYSIINRYKETVQGQFFGHVHADSFQLIYDTKETSRPIAVSYLGPSLTPYQNHHPSYRIYYIQGDVNKNSRNVIDHETWYLDLEKSNRERKPNWRKLYTASNAYHMKNLSPNEWDNVYKKMKTSKPTMEQFHKYFWGNSPRAPKLNDKIRRLYLCEIRSCIQYKN